LFSFSSFLLPFWILSFVHIIYFSISYSPRSWSELPTTYTGLASLGAGMRTLRPAKIGNQNQNQLTGAK
jgi:hypothetical protein